MCIELAQFQFRVLELRNKDRSFLNISSTAQL